MANQLVVGIFPSSDVAVLDTALANLSGIDRARLNVFTADPKTAAHDDSPLAFTHVQSSVSADVSPDVTHGTGSITDFGGTDVPGLTDATDQSLTDFEEPESVPNYLGSLPIPDDEVDNYNEAIAEGRTVVTYSTSSDAEGDQARQTLRAAGLRNTQVFQLR